MKAITKLLFVALVSMLGFASCDKQEEVAPTIEIAQEVVTHDTFIFTVKVSGADKCAYIIYDGDGITAERVFAEGVAIKNAKSPVVVDGLKRGTTYHIVAAAKNSVDAVLSNTLTFTTDDNGSGGNEDDPNEGNGGNDDPNEGNGGNDDPNEGNGGNDGGFELPEIEGVENIVITKTNNGRWYKEYNYFVLFERDNGDIIQLDFYTLSETMSLYLPYGQYSLDNSYAPYTIHPESSCYIPAGHPIDEFGYPFTDATVSVDVEGGYYAIYMMLTYDENGVEKSIQGYWNGLLSNASVPAGDDAGSDKLVEVLDVGSTSFKFRINAEPDQYWRCSVVDKRVYDSSNPNPGLWVINYGFMLQGPLTFNWVDGTMCEHVPNLPISVTSSTDYLIIAALMDYSNGQENSLLGGVEIVQVRTHAETAGTGSVDVTMKEINVNDVVFDCVFGDNVWCCYVAMMETANLQEIKDGKYAMAGYSSYEECMLSLVPDLSPEFKRQFMSSQYDYKWENLKYGTSYTLCIKVLDNNGGATYQEYEPFTTNR